MVSGKVKWFDNGTGYGFIQPNDGSVDVFFHRLVFQDQGGHPLQKGDEVLFETEADSRGPEATIITLLKTMPDP
jgi:cold shock protein